MSDFDGSQVQWVPVFLSFTDFFGYVALPLFKAWSQFTKSPLSRRLCQNIISNKSYWDDLITNPWMYSNVWCLLLLTCPPSSLWSCTYCSIVTHFNCKTNTILLFFTVYFHKKDQYGLFQGKFYSSTCNILYLTCPNEANNSKSGIYA